MDSGVERDTENGSGANLEAFEIDEECFDTESDSMDDYMYFAMLGQIGANRFDFPDIDMQSTFDKTLHPVCDRADGHGGSTRYCSDGEYTGELNSSYHHRCHEETADEWPDDTHELHHEDQLSEKPCFWVIKATLEGDTCEYEAICVGEDIYADVLPEGHAAPTWGEAVETYCSEWSGERPYDARQRKPLSP